MVGASQNCQTCTNSRVYCSAELAIIFLVQDIERVLDLVVQSHQNPNAINTIAGCLIAITKTSRTTNYTSANLSALFLQDVIQH